MRKLSWIIAGILSTAAPMVAVQAAQLGNAKVESKLTQPLNVQIPITDLNSKPLDEVRVRLASERYFRQAGIPLDNVQGNLRFQIKKGKHGPYVQVTSRRPITDPILSFLLQIKAGDSSMIREYDLLLDPPGHKRHVAGAARPETRHATAATTPSASPKKSGWKPVQSVPDVKMGGSYTVKPGDTLYEIAKKATRSSKIGVRPMMQAIVNANPGAFRNGNGNLMLAGAHLKVPESATAVEQGSQASAAATKPTATDKNASQPKLQLLSAMPSQPNESDNSQAENTPSPAKTGEAGGHPETGQGGASEANGQAPSRPLPSEKLPAINNTAPTASAEDIASLDAKNDAMSKQIALLNQQLKQLQGMTTARNDSVEQLQKKIRAAEQQTNSLKAKLNAQQNNFWARWGQYLIGGMGLLVIFLLFVAISERRRLKSQQEQFAEVKPVPETRPEPTPEPIVADDKIDQPPEEVHRGPMVDVSSPITTDARDEVEAAVQEARLLVSYNLHGQAIDLLNDAIEHHPNEPDAYNELARIFADEGKDDELNIMLDRIEERFGPSARPDIQSRSSTHQLNEDFSQTEYIDDDGQEETSGEPVNAEDKPSDQEESLDLSFEQEGGSGREHQHDPLDDIDFDTGAVGATEDQTALDLGDETGQPDEDLEPLSVDSTPPAEQPEEAQSDDLLDLDLPETETPATSEADLNLDEEQAETDQPQDMELDAAEEAPSSSGEMDAEPGNGGEADDTRLGLAEAFLSVGDNESFQMIADELSAEGNEATMAKLREIEQAHKQA